MKKLLAYILTVLCVLCVPLGAYAQSIQTGTVMTAPGPYDITVVLPESMINGGSSEAFAYGYIDETMLVGLTPLNYTDFDKLYAERIGEDFAKETKLTINGLEARQYTPRAKCPIEAIYAVQAGEGNWILELAFYPSDSSASAKNQAKIDQVLSGLRSRSATMEEDFDQNWHTAFSHTGLGLAVLLPGSMVKRAEPLYEDTVVEYQNDYISMLLYAYEGTVAEYEDYYQMNEDEFYIIEMTVNDVPVHVYQPKSDEVSTDCAYVVAEGNKGTLLHIIFGANNPAEQDENWEYINRIIMNIAAL